MNFKRIGMTLVSLVMVCCLLVNVSPIKAEAIAFETSVAIGCAAVLALASCGVIFNPKTQEDFKAIGNAFSCSLYQWGTSAEKLTEVDEFVGGLSLYEGGDDDDPYDKWWKFAKGGIWGGIAAFIVGVIADNGIDVESDSISSENWFYNGYELPPYRQDVNLSEFPYVFIGRHDGLGNIVTIFSSAPVAVSRTFRNYYRFYDFEALSAGKILIYKRDTSLNTGWSFDNEYTVNSGDSAFCLANTIWGNSLLWSNKNVYGTQDFNYGQLIVRGTEPTKFKFETISPDLYLGDIPEKVKNNEYDAETLPLPDVLYYGNVIDPDLGAVQSVINLADDLAAGKITFEEYKTLITAPPQIDPVPDPSEPEVTTPGIDVPSPDIDSGTLAETNPNTFLERLGAYIASPFKWIWTKIETYFDPLTRPELWTETIPEIAMAPARWIWEKIETFIAPLLDPDVLARPLPEIIAAPFQNLWIKLEPKIDGLSQSISQAAQNAADQVSEAVSKAVVPEKDYLTDKVNALLEEFAFADSIITTAKTIKLGLAGVTTEPPVIYIHLEDNRGSYDMGGTVPFLDLRWYAEYKPTVDVLISAFLWICFAWKMLLKLPGIISGVPGDFVMDSVHHIGMSEHMPVRKAEYEVQRISNREYIRRGPGK